ncbi:MAG: site-specific integrase [Actinomycetia bacterium]|nr:site-specific integrase [Actinomycetes bacterium]
MGFIVKKQRKDGLRYYAVYREPSGKKRWEGSFKLKKDAQAALKRREAEVAAGTYGREDITFQEFYERWITAKEKSLKASTLVDYKGTFKRHILPHFGRKHLSKIAPLDIQSWVNGLDLAPASVGRCYRYLRACLKQAETWGLIAKSPCRGIILPRVNREELSFLEPGEICTLLEEAREPERALFAVLAFSGLRLGEALALRWKDVNYEMRCITVERSWNIHNGFSEPKTAGSRRAVPLLPTLAAILQDYYREEGNPPPDDLLFTYDGVRPMDGSNTRKEFKTALKAAGLKRVTLHSLRHSFASMMLESGCSIKALQRSLGHSSAMVTLDTYSHLIEEDVGDSLLKLDAIISTSGGKLIHLKERRETPKK